MEEEIRRLSARYGWDLSDEEIQRIATETVAQEKVLDRLRQVDLAQTRPIMGIFKSPLASTGKRRRK